MILLLERLWRSLALHRHTNSESAEVIRACRSSEHTRAEDAAGVRVGALTMHVQGMQHQCVSGLRPFTCRGLSSSACRSSDHGRAEDAAAVRVGALTMHVQGTQQQCVSGL